MGLARVHSEGRHCMTSSRPGGQLLVDQLVVHGTDRVFCVPGESYLDVLDAFYDVADSIELVVARQEGGAAFMAAAHGKLTGRPGVCFVTRGPGAMNASIGVHTASQDSSPMLLFVGQVPRTDSDRDAFQEIDVKATFGSVAKAAFQIDDAARIPEQVARAFHLAVSGRPGPVVIGIPEDMQRDSVAVSDAPPYREARSAPDPTAQHDAMSALTGAARPVIVVGGSGWDTTVVDRLNSFAADREIPVVTAFRQQDLFDNLDERYGGTLGLGATPGIESYAEKADVVMVLGSRLDAMSTAHYQLFAAPRHGQCLIQVHPDLAELGRVYRPDIAVNTSVGAFLEAAGEWTASGEGRRAGWVTQLNENYRNGLVASPVEYGIDPGALVESVQRHAPKDAVITNGAGVYTTLPQRYYRSRHYPSQLAPQSGAMGYGLPAAVAAQLAERDRTVVAFAGDGCLLMNGQELATAMRYELPILVVLLNNSRYGTIRAHQERRFPGRVSGTDLVNPDFLQYAEAFGAVSEQVTTNEEFDEAVERLLRRRRLALIEVVAPNLGLS